MIYTLPGDARAPRVARQLVFSYLAGTGIPRVADPDDVILATSELVTNAVQAGASQVVLDIVTWDGCLELHVEDDAPGVPAQGAPDLESIHGRGLLIVSTIADAWTVRATGHGKEVVARFC